MHFQNALIALFAAVNVAVAGSSSSGECSGVKGYSPALSFCSAYFPAPIPTVTRTTTVTVKGPKTTPIKAPATTPKAGKGSTRTLTAFKDVTVTNCHNIPTPVCQAGKGGSGNKPRSEYIRGLEQLHKKEAAPALEARDSYSQFVSWAKVLAAGKPAIQKACACILPPPNKTSTTYVTATVTGKP